MNNKQVKVFIRTLFNKNHIKVEDMEYTANTDIPTETYIEYNILTSKREGPNDKKYLNPFQEEEKDYMKKRVLSFDKFDINHANQKEMKEDPLLEPKRKKSSNSL